MYKVGTMLFSVAIARGTREAFEAAVDDMATTIKQNGFGNNILVRIDTFPLWNQFIQEHLQNSLCTDPVANYNNDKLAKQQGLGPNHALVDERMLLDSER